MDLNVITAIDDMMVGDDVSRAGDRKSCTGGRSNSLAIVCYDGRSFPLGNFYRIAKLIVLPNTFLYASIGIGIGALPVP